MGAAADFVGLLIAFLFVAIVSSTLGNLPIIGQPIRAWCDSLQPKFAAIKQTLLFPISILSLFFTHTIRCITQFSDYLPYRGVNWVNDAEAAVSYEVQELHYRALQWVNDAEAAVRYEMAQQVQRVLGWVNEAEAAVSAEVSSLQSRALNWVNDAESTLRGEITSAVDSVRDWATDKISSMQATLSDFQDRALQWVNQGEAEVRRDLATDYVSIQERIKAIEQALSNSRAAEISDVAAVAAAVAGVTEALSDLEKNCVNNLCFNLKDLADTIGDMDEAAELAALIALLSQAAADPKAAANTVNDLFGGAVSDVYDAVSRL